MTDSPVSKHQRKFVSQVKHSQNPANFSKTHVHCIKMIDSTPELSNQSEMT